MPTGARQKNLVLAEFITEFVYFKVFHQDCTKTQYKDKVTRPNRIGNQFEEVLGS